MRIVMSKRLIYLMKLFRLKAFYYDPVLTVLFSFPPIIQKLYLIVSVLKGKRFSFLCFFMSDPRFSYFCQCYSHFDNIISWNNDLRYRPWLCRKYSFKHLCCKKRLSRYVSIYQTQLQSLMYHFTILVSPTISPSSRKTFMKLPIKYFI